MMLTGIPDYFKHIWKGILSADRKIKAFILVAIITLSALIGITLYNPPKVGTPAGVGDLNVTDQGTWRQVDLVDEDGSHIRFRFVEDLTEYAPNGMFEWDYGAKYSLNVTNSSTNQVCEKANVQIRGVSWSDIDDTGPFVIESGKNLYIVRWDLVWNHTDANVSGKLYLAFVNHLGWNPIGVEATFDQGSDSSVDIFIEVNANGGLFSGGSVGTADLYTVQNTAYLQCEDDARDPGQAAVRWDSVTSAGNWQDNHTWDNYGAQTRYQKAYKCDNDPVGTGDTTKFVLFYKIIQGYTNWELGKQFDDTYDLNDTTSAINGKWKGMNVHNGFYEIEAANRIASWKFDGDDSIIYTPMIMITNLGGNSTYYIVKNGSTTLTKGSDYWSHWNGTTGILYIWFKNMNGNPQTFLVEEYTTSQISTTQLTDYIRINWTGSDGYARSADMYNVSNSENKLVECHFNGSSTDIESDGSNLDTQVRLGGAWGGEIYNSSMRTLLNNSLVLMMWSNVNVTESNTLGYIQYRETAIIDGFDLMWLNITVNTTGDISADYERDIRWAGSQYGYFWNGYDADDTNDWFWSYDDDTDIDYQQVWFRSQGDPTAFSVVTGTWPQFAYSQRSTGTNGRYDHFTSWFGWGNLTVPDGTYQSSNGNYSYTMARDFNETDITVGDVQGSGYIYSADGGMVIYFASSESDHDINFSIPSSKVTVPHRTLFIIVTDESNIASASLNGISPSRGPIIDNWDMDQGKDTIVFVLNYDNGIDFTVSWTLGENTDPTVNSPSDQQWTYGTSPHTIGWIVSDSEQSSGPYTVYKNGSYWDSGTWTDSVSLDIDVASLPAGMWNMTITASDNQGGSNATDTVYVDVQKATPSLECYLNGTAGDKSYTVGEYMNLTGTVNPSLLTVVVEFTNGTDISTPASGTSSSIEDSSLWGAGTYYVQSHTDGNANYTAANSSTRTLTISVGNTDPSVNSPADQSWTYGTSPHTIGWIVIDAEQTSGSYTSYKNGTKWSGGTWNNNTAIDVDVSDLPAGYWNMTISATDGQGGANATDTVYINVTKASPTLECYLNGTAGSKNYLIGTQMNLTGSVSPSDLVVVVEFTNGTDISTPSTGVSTSIEDSSSWGSGTYYVRAHTNGNANYTSADSSTRTIEIGTFPPVLNSPSDQSWEYGTSPHVIPWVVTDGIDTSGDYTVYKDNVYYSSGSWTNGTSIDVDIDGLGVGGPYNFTIDATDGTYNDTDTVFVTVTQVSGNPINWTTTSDYYDLFWHDYQIEGRVNGIRMYRIASNPPFYYKAGTYNTKGPLIPIDGYYSSGWSNWTVSVLHNTSNFVLFRLDAVLNSTNTNQTIRMYIFAMNYQSGMYFNASFYVDDTNISTCSWGCYVDRDWSYASTENSFLYSEYGGVRTKASTNLTKVMFWSSNETHPSDDISSSDFTQWASSTSTLKAYNPYNSAFTAGDSIHWEGVFWIYGERDPWYENQTPTFIERYVSMFYTMNDVTMHTGSLRDGQWMLGYEMDASSNVVNFTITPDGNKPYSMPMFVIHGFSQSPNVVKVNGSVSTTDLISTNQSLDITWFVLNGSIYGETNVYIAVSGENTDPTVNSPADQTWEYGTTGHTIDWVVSDNEQASGDYTVYKNETFYTSGTWSNGVSTNVNIDGLALGTYNFTISATDGQGGTNATDTVWVTVASAVPTVKCYVNGTEGGMSFGLNSIMNLTGTVSPPGLTVVVEFTNGTDISTPSAGTSTAYVNTSDWGSGTYYIQSHTDGNSTYTAVNSSVRTIVIGSGVHAQSVVDWIKDQQHDDNYMWGPRNLTYHIHTNTWESEVTNAFSTAYAIAALKILRPSDDIPNQADLINEIKSYQSSTTGQFNSGLTNVVTKYKYNDHYWCIWSLSMMGSTPTYPSLAVSWLNDLQSERSDEAYWDASDDFEGTYYAVMSILTLENTDKTNISNWDKVKNWTYHRQNADGGFDLTNVTQSNMEGKAGSGKLYGNRSYVMYTGMAVDMLFNAGEVIPNQNDIITFLKNAQNPDGGWGYWDGDEYSSNIYCTYWAVKALNILGSAPDNVSGAIAFADSCQGNVGFAHRPMLLEIMESTYYATYVIDTLGGVVKSNGSHTMWTPPDIPDTGVYAFTWEAEAWGVQMANDPYGMIAGFYRAVGLDHVSMKQAGSAVPGIRDYVNLHGLDINFTVTFEDYASNPWMYGIYGTYNHCNDVIYDPERGSPAASQDIPFEDFVPTVQNSLDNIGGLGGYYHPNNFARDSIWMDYRWKQDPFKTGEFLVYVGHYWVSPWYTGTSPGVGVVLERWWNNRSHFPNCDAHKSIWNTGASDVYAYRGVFIAPNNTIEGLKYAVKRGWTASVKFNGDGWAMANQKVDSTDTVIYAYPKVAEWLDEHNDTWRWWGEDKIVPNPYVYPISNGTKYPDDYYRKSSDETSTWGTDRDGVLIRIYYWFATGGTVTIHNVSIGTPTWERSWALTMYHAYWSDDDYRYADYKWAENTDMPMGTYRVRVGYTLSGDGSHYIDYLIDIGSVPAPIVLEKNVFNRTLTNGMVMSFDPIASPQSAIENVWYRWDDSGNWNLLSSPYNITIGSMSEGGHKLTIRVTDHNYTETYDFYCTYSSSAPTLSAAFVGNKTVWDNDNWGPWYDIYPSLPGNGNATVYLLLDGQTNPKIWYEKRYANYSFVFDYNSTNLTKIVNNFDGIYALWAANISIAPGMNVTYWVEFDDTSLSNKYWFKVLPDPFQEHYGTGVLASWSETWDAATALDKLDEINGTLMIPINLWGQTSPGRYFLPFEDPYRGMRQPEDGYFQAGGPEIDGDWKDELDSRDPYRTKYKLDLFFYHRTFRDETPLDMPCPRTPQEWDTLVGKFMEAIGSEPSFNALVLDQEYASYHEMQEMWRMYVDWDDDLDGTLESSEWEQHIVDTFLKKFREVRYGIDYGGQPHLGYRWNGHILPDNIGLRGSINHFQHADENGGTPNYFRTVSYVVPDSSWSMYGDWSPGLYTMGVSPAASDLGTDYRLHWTNETHGTSTQWDDFGFADQVLHAALLNAKYITLWVHGSWDDTVEPYAFTQDEKDFVNSISLILNKVPYIGNLTYIRYPYGGTLASLSYGEKGVKPSWLTTNASDGLYFSIMKERGSMYQIVIINLQTSQRTLNITLGSGLFNEYNSNKLVSFNAVDGSSWIKLNNTAGERSFTVTLGNSSLAIYKFGIPFEVLGLPFEYDGYQWSSWSAYPSVSNMSVNSFDWNDLNITVNSPVDQFFKFYVPTGESWTLVINNASFDGTNTISVSSVPSKLGLISAGATPSPNTDPSVNSPSDQTWAEGTTGHKIGWIITDPDDNSGPYTIYRNGTYQSSGTWTSGVSLAYSIDGTPVGYWNFTITASDTHGGSNATDTVFVNVTSNTNPTINSPSDQQWVNGTTGHTIGWIITDGEQTSGAYTIYKNGTKRDSGTWNNATSLNYNVDGLGYGYWNLTITATDGQGGANATDIVFIDVQANLTFTPSLNPPGATTLNVTGNIEDFPVNLTPTGQTDTYAIFKIDWIDGADYEYGAIDVNFSSIPSGVVFYLDDDSDFSSAVAWNSTDYGTTKEVIDHTVATDPDYIWMKVYMPANQGGFSFTVYFWSREDG
ncbi:MAG: prenyltransferase/squalene oxidase repeat-containing protein [Candidatus Thorarchaeota archaeon]